MSNAGTKPGLLAYWLFPFAVFHTAIFIFSFNPRLHRSAPKLSFVQIKPHFPALGLFPSVVIHATVVILFLCLAHFHLLNPPRIIEIRWDDVRSTPLDSPAMPKLYYPAQMALQPVPASIHSGAKFSNASTPHSKGNTLTPPARHVDAVTARSMYSGPQEVVSISPAPTNSIQTILRPDLVNPPTLKFPQLLKPIVMLQSVVSAPSAANPANPVAPPTSAERIENGPVEPPAARVANSTPLPSMEKRSQPQPLPRIESEIPASGSVAAIVLNAVTVPENAPVAVPRAELSGTFAVRPVQSAAGGGTSGESTASSDATKAANKVAQGGSEEAAAVLTSETPTGKGADGPNATGKTSVANGAGSSIPSRSSQVTGLSHGVETEVRSQAAHAVPSITIIGGTSRGGTRVSVSATTSASYGLTVISSGTSGGASRDLGVFGRSETVYTVYIPMADVGGGPDWSMQYAILGPQQAGNGLLTPPVAVKKVRAVVRGDVPGAPPSIIFFSAVISAKGELSVNLPRQMDARAHQALDALRHWEFLPAQLNGIAVSIKVLVGVGTVSQ